MGRKDYEEYDDCPNSSVITDPALPDPGLLEFYRLLEERKIVWNQEITNGVIDVSMYILKWNEEDRGVPVEDRSPIRIYINTYGGDTSSVMLLADIIALSKTPVYTIGMGIAYSAGGLLLMSGHKRYIFNGTSVLIHDGSTGFFGDTGKVLDNLEFAKKIEDRVKSFITSHTKISNKLLEKNYRKDWFMFADEAVEYGVADEIVRDIDAIT